MKRMDKTRMTVLGIGCVAVMASSVGAINNMSVVELSHTGKFIEGISVIWIVER